MFRCLTFYWMAPLGWIKKKEKLNPPAIFSFFLTTSKKIKLPKKKCKWNLRSHIKSLRPPLPKKFFIPIDNKNLKKCHGKGDIRIGWEIQYLKKYILFDPIMQFWNILNHKINIYISYFVLKYHQNLFFSSVWSQL